jgi:hypothetical protein
MLSKTLIGLFYLLGCLNNHVFCCSEVEYIKYNYMPVMVLSKVVAAETLQSDGIWSRLNPRNHYKNGWQRFGMDRDPFANKFRILEKIKLEYA